MVKENANTSQTRGIIVQEGAVGKPAALNGGQNKHSHFRRASTSSYCDGGNSRRDSSGKFIFPNNGPNVVPRSFRASTGSLYNVANSGRNFPSSRGSVIPHYLRASTGSCHDFCKYGRKHEFEVKARSSFPKKIIKIPSNKQNPTESVIPAERNTTKVVKPKPSLVSNIRTHEVPSPSTKNEFSSRQTSSKLKKKIVSGTLMPTVKPKTMIVKRLSSPDTSGVLKDRRRSGIPAVKPKTMTVKPLPSPDSSGGLKCGRKREIKIGKTTGSSQAVAKKAFVSSVASLSPKPSLNFESSRSLRIVCPPKDEKRIRKADTEKVQKTLHVIKVETVNKALESTQKGRTIHSPPAPLLPSLNLSSHPKSPSTLLHEDDAQEEFEFPDSIIHSPPSQSLSSPKLSSPTKSPSFSSHDDETQELEHTDDIIIQSPPLQSLSSPRFSSLPKSASLSFHEGGAQEEFESMDSTIPSPPLQSLASPRFASLLKSPSLSFRMREAREEFESIDGTAPFAPPQSLSPPRYSTFPKSPSLSFHEGEAQEEGESTDSTAPYPPPQSLSSPKFASLPKSPSLSFREGEAQEEFEYTDSEADEYDDSISESSESMNMHEVETSHANHNRVPKKAGIGLSEGKDCVPTKLKFRRGKVVELHPESGGPRRLRFRRGRVLVGNQDSKNDFRRRKFKVRGVDDETKGTEGNSGIVVLRHQDVEEKKDAQGLFNNVIKETASKLAESRKSKVKALVGAFETVISLQEN